MFGFKDFIVRRVRIFLEETGIEPLYFATVVCILIVVSYWYQFKNWNNIEGWRKGLAVSSLFAAITLTIISLLRILGMIDF